MLRVASVIATLSTRTGGPILNLVGSVPHLARAGVEVTIFTTDMGGPASAPASRAGPDDFPAGAAQCDVRVFRAEAPRRLSYSPGLRQALQRDAASFDLVRVHGVYLYPNYVAAASARRAGVPYIVTPHGALDPWMRRHGRARKLVTNLAWQNRMLRDAAAIHATTTRDRELLADVAPAGVPRYVVGNGVDVEAFATVPSRGALRRELGIAPDRPMLLFLSRVSRKKGIDILLRAAARLGSLQPAVVVVGPDDEGLTGELRTLARELGLEASVYFAGARYGADRLQALADGDVWVLPSHTENFGNAVVEAMSAGVPVVVSDAVNLAPEISAARAGFVTTRDPDSVAAACHDALTMAPDEKARLTAAGRAFASRFEWPVVAEELASMFTEVVDRSRR